MMAAVIHSPNLSSMQNLYRLRRLAADDLDAFHQLRLQALQESPTAFGATVASEQSLTPAQHLARLQGDSHSGIWGAWNSKGALVASAGLWHQTQEKVQHKADVYAVYVEPSARGAGLAAQLMKTMIAHAREHTDLRQLHLGVIAGNTHALRLYQSLGFVEYGLEPAALCVNDYYHDEYLMQLRLRD